MKDSTQRSHGTRTRSQKSTAEEKLIASLEREIVSLQRANAKLLRMVEMVMEERFYRPVVTGGVRENLQTPGLPLESLSDVSTFDEAADAAQSEEQQAAFVKELNAIAEEHREWRKEKGLAHEEADATAA